MAGLQFNTDANQHRALQQRIKALKSIFGPAEIDRVLQHHANNLVGRIKQEAPVDTGRLRRNVKSETFALFGNNAVRVVSSAIDPQTGEDYTYVQNFGDPTRNIPATYYFTRTAANFARKIYDDLGRRFRRELGERGFLRSIGLARGRNR